MKKFSYGYVLSFISAVLILLQVIGIKIDAPYVNEVATAILGVLAALGIVSGKDDGVKKEESIDGTKETLNEETESNLPTGKTSDGDDVG